MPNKMERFTNHARLSLNLSQKAAEEFGSPRIQPVHLLLAMTRAEDTDAYHILEAHDIIASKLAPFVKAKQAPSIQNLDDATSIDLSRNTKKVLELSVDEAFKHGHYFVGTSHLLLGLLRAKLDEVHAILHHFDVQAKDLHKFTESYLAEDKNDEPTKSELPVHPVMQRIPSTKVINWREVVQSIFRFGDKRKNSE